MRHTAARHVCLGVPRSDSERNSWSFPQSSASSPWVLANAKISPSADLSMLRFPRWKKFWATSSHPCPWPPWDGSRGWTLWDSYCSVITGPFCPHLDGTYAPLLVHPESSGLISRPTSPWVPGAGSEGWHLVTSAWGVSGLTGTGTLWAPTALGRCSSKSSLWVLTVTPGRTRKSLSWLEISPVLLRPPSPWSL